MTVKPGLLHDPETLTSLAKQLRSEADRMEARAQKLKTGEEKVGCAQGCWATLSACVYITPM